MTTNVVNKVEKFHAFRKTMSPKKLWEVDCMTFKLLCMSETPLSHLQTELNSSVMRMPLHDRPNKKVHCFGVWQPSEANTYADVEACFEWLREEKGVREEDIILYGQSVGSGPTCDLASQRPHLRGVILHSPILSGVRVLYEVKRTYWFDVFKVRLHCSLFLLFSTRSRSVGTLKARDSLWYLMNQLHCCLHGCFIVIVVASCKTARC